MLVGACRDFQFFRKITYFLGNRTLSKLSYGFYGFHLIIIIKLQND